jgi:PAS domain S-box-containing protein
VTEQLNQSKRQISPPDPAPAFDPAPALDPAPQARTGQEALPQPRPRPVDQVRSAELAGMQRLLEAVQDAMVVVDADGLVVMINSEFERLLGWTRADLLGQSIELLIPERHRRVHPEHPAGYLTSPVFRTMGAGSELSVVHRDGTELPADINLSSTMTDQGLLVTVAVRDLSERRAMEEKFRRFVESSPDAVVIADHDGKIIVINTQTEKVFGYSREELLGQSVEMIVPQPLLDRGTANHALFFASPKVQLMGTGLGLELFGQRKDGSQFPIEISQSPLQTEAGLLVSSAIRDVTQRHKADQLRFRLAAIVEGSDDAIISTDLNDIVTSWNRGAETLYGYSEEEMIGRSLALLLPPDRVGEDAELLAELLRDERIRHRDSLRRTKDGRDVVVSMTISPIRDQAGVLIGGSKVARDITERTNAERALAEAKERAEITSREYEAFSYSVAHDLRAPLRALDGFSQRLMERHADVLDAGGQEFLRRIGDSVQYMGQLIDSLLRLARLSNRELVHECVDLSLLATEALDRLRSESPERAVEVVVAPGLITQGDRGLLNIVFENLLGNAWKFSRNRSPSKIEFGQTQVEAESAYFIRDNGAGFDMAYAAKLFGVFQRLHNVREFEGTGIGLVTVQRIIARHGGRVWAEGLPEHGATFYFTLESKEQ